MRKCSLKQCFAPGTTCAAGWQRPQDCENFEGSAEVIDKTNAVAVDDHTIGFPWTGSSLGLGDLHLVSATRKPEIVGLIGPHSSGKSTILAVSYLLLFNGMGLGGRSFAGSLSLAAWEQISSYLKFQGHTMPTFPPHTPLGKVRVPGMLHLALSNVDGKRDFLITDPPGEWFDKWVLNADDPDAQGARWIAQHSTKFLFVVDTEKISIALGKPANKYKILDLAARVSSVLDGRPIVIVWSKSDRKVDPDLRESIRQQLSAQLSGAKHFEVSVLNPSKIVSQFQTMWEWTFGLSKYHSFDDLVTPHSGHHSLRFRG